MFRRIVAALPILMVLAMPAHADFRSGIDAFKRGDYAVAKAAFEVLTKQGMTAAQTNLGLMNSKGYGVPINEAEAVRWYLLTAEKDHPVAQNNLPYMHINGQDLSKDRVLGLMWLTFFSENGYART
jgi:TPR repeat protein